jgi:hypothetical protein
VRVRAVLFGLLAIQHKIAASIPFTASNGKDKSYIDISMESKT